MGGGLIVKNLIAFLLLVISLCCLFILSITVLRLPDVANKSVREKTIENVNLGQFGEMMIRMLPEDLSFTLFMPSQRAFERDLRLRVNDSLVPENMDDTYAIVSRILSFSAVPRSLFSVSVPVGKELTYDAVSGYPLYVSRDVKGVLVVNGVKSEVMDLRVGRIVVHVMDGVIMDADFEQSVQPDDVQTLSRG